MVDWGQIREPFRWRSLLFNEHFNILQAIEGAVKIFWSEKKLDHRQINPVVTIRMNWSMERLEDFWEVYWGSILIPWLRWEVLRTGTWAMARKTEWRTDFEKISERNLATWSPGVGVSRCCNQILFCIILLTSNQHFLIRISWDVGGRMYWNQNVLFFHFPWPTLIYGILSKHRLLPHHCHHYLSYESTTCFLFIVVKNT